MRSYLTLIVAILLAPFGAAELPTPTTLDAVLALATRPEQPTREDGIELERLNAFQRLRIWPRVTPKDEARITAAFYAALEAKNEEIRKAGAYGLGQRGHSEAIPTILKLGEKDSLLISCFFVLYTSGREVAPPVDLLRRSLRSKNPGTRLTTLQAIAFCKATALRREVEEVLATDESSNAREWAGNALWEFGLPESVPALRNALTIGEQSQGVVRGLTQLGSDEDIAAVLPLLKSKDETLRRTVAKGLAYANPKNSRPACDALLEALNDRSNDVRIDAMLALGHFREKRAISQIRERLTAQPPRPISWDDIHFYVDAVRSIGGEEAIALLDSMVTLGFRNSFGLEDALTHFASPSSARAVWEAYLKDPIRVNPSSDVGTTGYHKALDVLAACADTDLLQKIQDRLPTTRDEHENSALAKLIARIQTRLNR